MSEVFLATRAISKSFSGVQVLKNIDIDIPRSAILGIIGENGAGKSTLMKIISGLYTPSSGHILINGKRTDIRNPEVARDLGISIIPQEFNIIETLSISENIFLGKELTDRYGFTKKKEMRTRSQSLLDDLEVTIDPEASITSLSAAEKQMVEISKALSNSAELLIMDEPTTVLTEHETRTLFNLVRKLKHRNLAIVFVSHKLNEVKKICDEVVVLRDGELIVRRPTATMSKKEMVRNMVGREIEEFEPPERVRSSETALDVRNLCDGDKLSNISFAVKRGEILGLAGLVGAGRTEIAEAVIGVRRIVSGQVLLDDRPVQIGSPSDAYRLGIGYLSEDRQERGIITSFPLFQNISLTSIDRYCRFFFRMLVRRKELESASAYRERFNIKAHSLDTVLSSLSGGNQQKVSLAKIIDTRPRILILDEPTRGVDVSAKQEIYTFIRTLAGNGIACVLISSEQEEIIKLCHRVIVIRNGTISGELQRQNLNEENIMYLATGTQDHT